MRALGPDGRTDPVPRVLGRVPRVRPLEVRLAAGVAPAALEVGLDLRPLPVAVHHPRLPTVLVRGAPELERLTLLHIRAGAVVLAPVPFLDRGVHRLRRGLAAQSARNRTYGRSDHRADRSSGRRTD